MNTSINNPHAATDTTVAYWDMQVAGPPIFQLPEKGMQRKDANKTAYIHHTILRIKRDKTRDQLVRKRLKREREMKRESLQGDKRQGKACGVC